MKPGEVIIKEGTKIINEGKQATKLRVKNTGDRPIQVGSHFHFFETNKGLEFDRDKAYGKRLDIPAGAAVRFEPGDEKEVSLIEYAGERNIFGFRNLVDGPIDDSKVYRPE
ncbi:urease subunit beta [Macrococcus equipercicus]|uniref:Urease subunit beta n=1 Tax=Macrococcus equipercicus TaxID=69967 RepID=A0ABQ6RAP2_9STAP|nr:urease subunit beta [Macrococcus equipercicus]KAA1042322.1 urease subunit beta [Macrococcus equipercicus]